MRVVSFIVMVLGLWCGGYLVGHGCAGMERKNVEPASTISAMKTEGNIAPTFTIAGWPVAITHVARVDSLHLSKNDFQYVADDVWLGYASVCDVNGVIVDSVRIVLLSDKALDVNRDGRLNITDVTVMIGYLFRGGAL